MVDQDDDDAIRLVSFGMTILDELHLPGGRILHDVLGGSCAYSSVGACIAAGGKNPQIGCLVLAGNDFSVDAEEQIRGWGIRLVIRKSTAQQSVRGKVQYHDDDFTNKTFGYLTPPLQPTPRDLPNDFLASTAFHFLASPEQLTQQVTELLRLREEHGITARPLLVWEPLPICCRPNSLAAHIEASKLVDIFSPNHVELDSLCGRLQSQGDQAASEVGRDHVQRCTAAFLANYPTNDGAEQLCVVRSGEYGALVATRSENAAGADQIEMTWVDPFYSADERNQIVDATGAGNAFLGALAMELQQNGGDAVEAAVKASVACSFVVEQVGLPVFRGDPTSETQTWNGVTVSSRVEEYEKRLGSG